MIKTNTSTPSNSPGITITGGEPIIGIKAYEDYIQKNKKMNGEDSMVQGEVVVSFIINQNGLLSDFTVEKPLTTGINEEAIRLIRKGPGWKIPKGKNGNEKVIIPPKTWITIPF
jgi:protein TonB